MPRTSKKGLDFVPIDATFFSDVKIRKLIKNQGAEAIAVYTFILSHIYENGYYIQYTEDIPFLCAEAIGEEETYVASVISYCLDIELFSNKIFTENGVLTSRGIQERYKKIRSQNRKEANIVEYKLIQTKEEKKETPQNRKVKETNIYAPYKPHTLTLEEEVEELKKEECWLDQLQLLHHTPKEELKLSLDKFKVQCAADGMKNHISIQDAKKHFNNWLRIVNTKNIKQKYDTNSTTRNNKRRGNLLTADEKKTYSNSF